MDFLIFFGGFCTGGVDSGKGNEPRIGGPQIKAGHDMKRFPDC